MANTGLNDNIPNLLGGVDVDLDQAVNRIDAGLAAGKTYISDLESIRTSLDANDGTTTLGTMVKAQIQMTEAETVYMVRSGIPKKASSTVQAAAGDVKKAAG